MTIKIEMDENGRFSLDTKFGAIDCAYMGAEDAPKGTVIMVINGLFLLQRF